MKYKRKTIVQITLALLLLCPIWSSHVYSASIVVTSSGATGDVDEEVNGNCSLYEAINAATTNTAQDACVVGDADNIATDEIVLPRDASFSIPQTLFLFSDLTIIGNDSTIERDESVVINTPLVVIASGAVTLEDMTIRGGDNSNATSPSAGGVQVAGGTGILRRLVITENKSLRGGGISVTNTGELHLVASEVSHNQALDPTDGEGGGIYIEVGNRDHKIENSRILHNSAATDGGGISTDDNDFLRISVTGSEIAHNTVPDDRFGGGIHVPLTRQVVSIEQSSIHNNSAGFGGAGHFGLAIYLRLNRSVVYDNIDTGSRFLGGLYFSSEFATLDVRRSTVSGNSGIQISHIQGSVAMFNSTIVGNSGFPAIEARGLLAFVHTIVTSGIDGASPVGSACKLSPDYVPGFFPMFGNWFSDDTCNGVASGNPMLGPLVKTIGSTMAHIPDKESPLVDQNALDPDGIKLSDVDQRGVFRGATDVDIGSIELTDDEKGLSNFIIIPVRNGKSVVVPL